MFRDPRHSGDLASDPVGLAGAAAVTPFALTETEIGDGCREIGVEGELDSAVTDRLRQAIAGCQGDRVLIGLESCQFIDATAIALIVSAHRGEDFLAVAHSPRGQVLRVLEATGLIADGLVFADRAQALSAVSEPVSS